VSTWPDPFYGICPDVADGSREEYKQNAVAMQAAFRLDVAFDDSLNPNVYFGLLEAY